MPTYNRRPFVLLALQGFMRQDYENRELVVVDDGSDSVADLCNGMPGIHYIRLGGRTSIGNKRNIACRAATGEVIVHWDDDDYYAENRLSYQCSAILSGEADMTGLVSSFVLQLPVGAFWGIRPELHRDMFKGDVHGGTIAYRRDLLTQGIEYPAVNLAEDASFIDSALRRGKRLARLPNRGEFIYVRHGQNAWRFEAGRFYERLGWERRSKPQSFSLKLLAAYQTAAAIVSAVGRENRAQDEARQGG
jgi:glycosyltransferase involved in cell wall biosynthesis